MALEEPADLQSAPYLFLLQMPAASLLNESLQMPARQLRPGKVQKEQQERTDRSRLLQCSDNTRRQGFLAQHRECRLP